MPAIIRKPVSTTLSKSNDPTNDAVAAINKNKALTVTARSVAAPSNKVGPVAGVNNSITLSPILNTSAKFGGGSVSITPQISQTKVNAQTQNRTLSPLSNRNVSSPIAITKVTTNQTVTKSPTLTPIAKPNVLSSRNSNTTKPIVHLPKSSNTASPVPSSPRVLNSSQSVSPKIVVQRTSPMQFKPIVAQTKAQVQAAATLSANKVANNSGMQVNRVVTTVKPNQVTSQVRPKIVGNRPNTAIAMVETRKRMANEPISLLQAKKHKPMVSSNLNMYPGVNVIYF